jgi:hypothetical protein
MSQELEDWKDLVTSRGWGRFMSYVAEELQTQLNQHIEKVANETDDAMALAKMRQVIAAKRATEQMIAYPASRIRQLEAPTLRQPSMARGGV